MHGTYNFEIEMEIIGIITEETEVEEITKMTEEVIKEIFKIKNNNDY